MNVIDSPVLSNNEVVKILLNLFDEDISEKSKSMIEYWLKIKDLIFWKPYILKYIKKLLKNIKSKNL